MNLQKFDDVSPVFVVGHARSGTTLLQMILNNHSNIAIYGEVHFFNPISDLKSSVPNLDSDENIDDFFQLLTKIKTVYYLPNYEDLFNKVKTKLKKDKTANYETFYKYLLEEYGEIEQATRWGDKTTMNVRYLEELLQIFPKAKIIHIVRNPKDVIASKIRVPWSPNSIIINAFKWKIDVLYGRKFAANHKNSYTEIRYEDLVSSPESEIKRLLNFIDEPFEDAILDFYKKSQEYVVGEPWKEGVTNPINLKSVGKGDKELSRNQISLIEQMIGKTWFERFNYQLSKSNASIIMLLATALEDVKDYINYKRNEKKEKDESDSINPNGRQVRKLFLNAIIDR